MADDLLFLIPLMMLVILLLCSRCNKYSRAGSLAGGMGFSEGFTAGMQMYDKWNAEKHG